MREDYIIIDGIKWWILNRNPQPLCPHHHLRLRPVQDIHSRQYNYATNSYTLKCEDCVELYKLPRNYQREILYVLDRLDAKIFKGQKFINLDDEAIPIAENKIPKDSEYFVTSLLTKSKVGLRLVVYAGRRGSSQKAQIFVEPDIKRLAFDQKDLHPNDVFTKVEATFADGSKASQEK